MGQEDFVWRSTPGIHLKAAPQSEMSVMGGTRRDAVKSKFRDRPPGRERPL
jgi:hypothetical protein